MLRRWGLHAAIAFGVSGCALIAGLGDHRLASSGGSAGSGGASASTQGSGGAAGASSATSGGSGGLHEWRLVQVQSVQALSKVDLNATRAGSLIVVSWMGNPNTGPIGVTDDAPGGSSAYAELTGTYASNPAAGASDLWFAIPSQAGATSIMVDGPPSYSIVVWEVAGIDPGHPVDIANSINQSGSGMTTGAPIKTALAGDFVVSAVLPANSATGLVMGDFTLDSLVAGNGFAHLTSPSAEQDTYRAVFEVDTPAGYSGSSAAFRAAP